MAEILIVALVLSQLRHHASFQLHTEVNALINTLGAGMLGVVDLMTKYTARMAAFDEALKKIVKSPITAPIRETDTARKEAYRALVSLAKAMSLDTAVDIREAAKKVIIVINTYGNVTRKNYEERTSAIYNLVHDLKSTAYATDVATAKLTDLVTRLESLNVKFSTLMKNRDNEAAAKSDIKVKEARALADKSLNLIVMRIRSFVEDADEVNDKLAEFVEKLNIIFKRFSTIEKRQHHHGKHKDGDNGGNGGSGGGGGDVIHPVGGRFDSAQRPDDEEDGEE